MSEIQRAFEENSDSSPSLCISDGPRPSRKLVILTCMDTRLDPYKALGLSAGEAHILRNAGAIVTEDVIRSLVLSHRKLGTRELMIIGHTDCGLCGLNEQELRDQLVAETGSGTGVPSIFHSFDSIGDSVKIQLGKIREHPWLTDLQTRGFVYNVESGRISEVMA